MSDLEQLVLEFDAPIVARPVLSLHAKAGPAQLPLNLVKGGLDPRALEAAAQLVVALDEGATA
jgi:hypothetical protein